MSQEIRSPTLVYTNTTSNQLLFGLSGTNTIPTSQIETQPYKEEILGKTLDFNVGSPPKERNLDIKTTYKLDNTAEFQSQFNVSSLDDKSSVRSKYGNYLKQPLYDDKKMEAKQAETIFQNVDADVEEFPDKNAKEIIQKPSVAINFLGNNTSALQLGNKLSTPYSSQFKSSPFLSAKSPRDSHDLIDEFELNENISNPSSLSRRASMLKSPLSSKQKVRTISFDGENKIKNVLQNEKMLSYIISYLQPSDILYFSKIYKEFRNERKYKRIFFSHLYSLFSKPLEKKDEYQYLNCLVNFKEIRAQHPFSFSQNFARDCQFFSEIRKDLDRTLPDYEKYSTKEGKEALFKVLVAISNVVKDVGYIQGLNSIAGVLLFVLKEEESFWLLIFLLEKINLKQIFRVGFPKIELLNYQLKAFIEAYLPNLSTHFSTRNYDISLLTSQWFFTLFSYSFMVPNIMKIWNIYLLKGDKFLLRFCLGILSKYESHILSIDHDEITTFLKYELKGLNEHDDSIFKEALKFKVTKRLLVDSEKHYNKGRPKLKLSKGPNGKLMWNNLSKQTIKKELSFNNFDKLKAKSATVQNLEKSPIVRKAENTPKNNETKKGFLDSMFTKFKTIFTKEDDLSPENRKGKNVLYVPQSEGKSLDNRPTEADESKIINRRVSMIDAIPPKKSDYQRVLQKDTPKLAAPTSLDLSDDEVQSHSPIDIDTIREKNPISNFSVMSVNERNGESSPKEKIDEDRAKSFKLTELEQDFNNKSLSIASSPRKDDE